MALQRTKKAGNFCFFMLVELQTLIFGRKKSIMCILWDNHIFSLSYFQLSTYTLKSLFNYLYSTLLYQFKVYEFRMDFRLAIILKSAKIKLGPWSRFWFATFSRVLGCRCVAAPANRPLPARPSGRSEPRSSPPRPRARPDAPTTLQERTRRGLMKIFLKK